MNQLIDTVLAPIVEFVISTISTLGYPGIALLMGIESAAIPLPSEIIMPFSGFLVSQGRFTMHGIALAGAIGSVFGSWVMYWIGKYGGRPLIRKYGSYVLITEHDLELVDRFFIRFGNWATFIGRMLPIIRTYISIPAGISRVPFWSFTISAFIGSYIWSYFLGWIGFKLGANWEDVRHYFRQVDWIIVLLLFVGLVWWVRRHWKNRLKEPK
jgi:membrane protein DedA with SNARE-associated domain